MSFFHPMRTLSFVIVTAFAVGFVATAARSETKTLQLKYQRWQIASTCAREGGIGWTSAAGFGCEKHNCDGKGGTCSVSCDNSGTCHGTTPIVAGTTAGTRLNPNLTDILKFQTRQSSHKPKAR